MPFRSFNTLLLYVSVFIIMLFISLSVEMYFKAVLLMICIKKKKNHYICYDLLWIVTGAFHLVDLQMIKNSQATWLVQIQFPSLRFIKFSLR